MTLRFGPSLLLCLGLVGCGAGFSTGLPDDDDDATLALPDDDDDDSTGAGLFEGDEPGECDDGADNDQDGLFDCDDPDCVGAPVCTGDDDDSTPSDDDDSTPSDDDDSTPADDDDSTPADDDDSTPADDDDSTPADDDDATTPPPSGAPVVQSVTWQWLPGVTEFAFTLGVNDPDCNLGSPTLLWTYNGQLQPSQSLPGANLTCAGTIYFNVGGATPGSTVNFTFQIIDSVGEFSNIWPLTVTAS